MKVHSHCANNKLAALINKAQTAYCADVNTTKMLTQTTLNDYNCGFGCDKLLNQTSIYRVNIIF
jgi:hypothetical protein